MCSAAGDIFVTSEASSLDALQEYSAVSANVTSDNNNETLWNNSPLGREPLDLSYDRDESVTPSLSISTSGWGNPVTLHNTVTLLPAVRFTGVGLSIKLGGTKKKKNDKN